MKFKPAHGFLLVIICLFVATYIAEGNPRANAEIVYPERIHKTRSKRDLLTALKDGKHEDSLSIRIKSKQENDLVLDLKKNDPIHPGSIMLRTYDKDGKPIHKRHVPDDCMYSGEIRDMPNSYAFISTCNGLTGSMDTGEKRYDIERNDDSNGHKFYNVDKHLDEIRKTLSKSPVAEMSNDDVEEEEETIEEDENVNFKRTAPEGTKKGAKAVRNFRLVNVEKQYIKYLKTNSTRFVEMFVSADHVMYKRYFNDTELVLERVLNALGQVDKAYQAINVRIVLVALEVQTNGPSFNRSRVAGTDLVSFRNHWRVLQKEGPFKDIEMDNAQLFSHHSWKKGIAGVAWVGGLCNRHISAGIDLWYFNSLTGPTVIIGHEFGHNMNFPHDGKGCTCLTRRGCFMGGHKTSRPGFSDCSMKRLAAKAFSCINNYPANPLSSVCGNGLKEKGEACDCGTPERCAREDPCCEPKDCKLKAEAQCTFLDNPLCCSKTCQFKKQGTLCRESFGNCDVPEYCTGVVATCPNDRNMMDGTHCGESLQMLAGPNKRGTKYTALTPPVIARYVKLVPQHWNRGGYACMKLEMLGCNPSKDSSLVATPIISAGLYYHSAMCLVPKNITSCDSKTADGTILIYKSMPNQDCNHPQMLYLYAADGTLTHQCSGKKICPSPDNKYMIISSKCKPDESKYTRTKKWSIKHIKTGRCIGSYGGWPFSGKHTELRGDCDGNYRRLEWHFQNTDCTLPLGFKNGKIPDSAFSAGSQHNSYTIPNIRLNKKGWCPKTKKDGGWFKIDFGKRVEIRTIIIGGNYWNWVHGFYLHYSDNGVLWNKYKESSATSWKDMNSYCYNGECAPTPDHQCKKLWEAHANKASDGCWNELNKNATGYGSCKATANVSCNQSDVFCGQLQCSSKRDRPYYINYGTKYKKIKVDGKTCSGAMITDSEEVGLGMVEDGTVCGAHKDGKYCVEQKCKTGAEHGSDLGVCHGSNQKICSGRGICTSAKKCHCDSGYNPDDNCHTLLTIVNGGWSKWSKWSTCTKACGEGKHQRHRFCNNPAPKYGGTECPGARVVEEGCNKEACLVARSCKDMKAKMEKVGKPVYDGVYPIKPTNTLTLKVYCDMTRNGGGWTLIVSSHENLWTPTNVKLRNIEKPELFSDYSILGYADKIKGNNKFGKFEYRLEANDFGKWGGIWEAPNAYSMASHSKYQQAVNLKTKFSNWGYSYSRGIGKRLPYISKQRITVGDGNVWGCITDNQKGDHPSRWISGNMKMGRPEHVWYWLREGDNDYAKSCLKLVGFGYKSGNYMIEPKPGKIVDAFCDFDRYGGGWTLLAKSSGPDGWTNDNVLNRNSNQVTKDQYSIYELVDVLKGNDVGEESFDYMIEAGGNDQNGGIFSFSLTESLLVSSSAASKAPTLIKKFGTWDDKVENIAKYPIRHVSNVDIFLAANSGKSGDNYGAIIAGKKSNGVYMTSNKNPSSVKVWIRAGGSRKSCNDIKIHGYHKGKLDYKDGVYMLKDSMPVYCDMTTTDKEGWTLLVTAANKGWTIDQVKMKNAQQPALYTDYSILGKADTIKSLSHGQFFKYMIDAQERRHWGGIWKAPMGYSFTSTSSGRRNVELLTQFGTWSYNKVWYRGPCKRMPYLASKKTHRGLLTTASYTDYTEWGTIVSNSAGAFPSMWISPQMKSPGVIWYWVNENDCDGDYRKVDGGYSLSMWSSCSAFCGQGVQVRTRKCNNPFPRCGGDQCDSSLKLREERSCTGPCTASQIKTPDGTFCLQPKSGGCNPADGTDIVFRTSDKCKGDEAIFVFNPSKGVIIHKCSNKMVCYPAGRRGTKLQVTSNCPSPTAKKHFLRTQFQSIYFYNHAMTPAHYKVRDGNHIVWWGSGMKQSERFVFTNKTFLHLDQASGKVCPASHPYVYLNGDYCCQYNKENVNTRKNTTLCDGSKIGITSRCCKRHAYSKCKNPPCTNYKAGMKTKETCHLKSGDGIGGTDKKVGSHLSKKACFAECLNEKESDPEINGITTYTSGKAGCWCEKNMNGWGSNNTFESCMFVAKIEGYKYGHVNSSYFASAQSFSAVEGTSPSKPTSTGFTDELATPLNFANRYLMQLKSYFKAPVTGYYTFLAACDDKCKVYLSNSTDKSNKKLIIQINSWTRYYRFTNSNQKSNKIHLEVGKQYYIEAMFIEGGGGDHMEIGAILPGYTLLIPITYDYLSNVVEGKK